MFQIHWQGAVNGSIGGITYAGTAALAPSTLATTGEDLVANGSGQEGFAVPGSHATASVDGTSTSWTSSIYSTDTASALAALCSTGIGQLTLTGTITAPVVATGLKVTLPNIDLTPSSILSLVPAETLTVSAVDAFGNVDPTVSGAAAVVWAGPPIFLVDGLGSYFYWQVNPAFDTPVEPTSVTLTNGIGSVSGVKPPMWGPFAFCYSGPFNCNGMPVWIGQGPTWPPTTISAQIGQLTGSVQQAVTLGVFNVTGYTGNPTGSSTGNSTYSVSGTGADTTLTVTPSGGTAQVINIGNQQLDVQSATPNPDGSTSLVLTGAVITGTMTMTITTPIDLTTNTATTVQQNSAIVVSSCVTGTTCQSGTSGFGQVTVIPPPSSPNPANADAYTQLVNVLGF
jgi:hypothetical protein